VRLCGKKKINHKGHQGLHKGTQRNKSKTFNRIAIPTNFSYFYCCKRDQIMLLNKILKHLLFFTLIAYIAESCGIARQGKQMAALAKCEFRIESITGLNLAGVNVEEIKSLSDLTIMDAQHLLGSVTGNTFPLNFILNIEARNPNSAMAGMNKMEWFLFIDDIQMTMGSVDQTVTIPGNNGTAIIPVNMALDLKQILQGKSVNAIINFGLNLSGAGNKPTRFKIKLKPTIMTGKNPVVYPGYITVQTEFVSQ
jgi:hypothetical protein